MVLAGSQMLTAHLAPLAPRTLKGQFRLTTDVTGRAPVAGEVARQLVNVGTHVEAGDRVLEVSSGVASRPAPIYEKQQDRAESDQVAVTRDQNALSQQLSIAQTQLGAAQERVTRAQEKVAAARGLVKRLLAGEQIPATGEVAAPAHPRRRKRERLTSDETSDARNAGRAEAAVSDAQSAAQSAQSDRDDAHAALVAAQKKADASKTALEKAKTDFKAETTTADVLEGARSEADDSASALKTAQSRADAADNALAARKKKLETAQGAAQAVREKPPISKSDSPSESAADSADEKSGAGRKNFLTTDQALSQVASALAESKAATRAADRMRARVDGYERTVNSTSHRAETANQEAQSAQQQVLDVVPRPLFTAARAPGSGTITWVSRLAREVSAGQAVFGLSQGHSAILRIEDKGEAWKSLKVGQTLNAASAAPETVPTAPSSDSQSLPAPANRPASTAKTEVPDAFRQNALTPPQSAPDSPNASGGAGATFSIRLTRISPPTQNQGAAIIEAVRVDGSAAPENADAVQVELPAQAQQPDTPSTGKAATAARPVVVPPSVILPRDGVNYVAVLESQPAPAHPSSEGQTVTLSWRTVEVARQTPFDVELRGGVRDGEQIVNQPALLLAQWKPESKTPLPVHLDATS